ncbi:MAG: glycosyltransferase family 2 protein [Cytophagales bacterium]|nr:glycosyltransferase family 2 protein [Cytophagales bacterium]
MEEIKSLLVAAGLLALCSIFLIRAHQKRKANRPYIYHQLYGPLFFLSVLTPFVMQFALARKNITLPDVLLMALTIPLYLQLVIALVMVLRLLFNNHDYQDPELVELKKYPKVAIILPTYHEPFEIAKMTLDSLIAMEYEGDWKIIVVDNSRDFEDLESWRSYVTHLNELFQGSNLEVEWISRDPELKGFKPLNLDVAYERYVANDWEVEYVMYADTDSTFHVNTLTDLVKTFAADEDAAYIQLMTVANNMEVNRLSKAVGMQQTIFRYILGEIGNWGMPIFYGHNAIYKRAVIAQLGSFLEKDSRGEFMLTEDFSMTIRAYLQGSYGKTHWILSGEGVPTSLAALKGMWDRWAVGGLQVLFKYFKRVVVSNKINFYEKVSFLYHGLSYPSNALIPVFILLSPMISSVALIAFVLLLLFGSISAIGFRKKFGMLIEETRTNPSSFVDYYCSFFAVHSYIFWVMFLSTWKFIYQMIVPRKYREKLSWVVTPKGKEEKMKWSTVLRNNVSILVFVGTFFAISGYFLWNSYAGMNDFLILLPGGFFCFNLLLTLLVFGRSRKTSSKPSVKSPEPFQSGEMLVDP